MDRLGPQGFEMRPKFVEVTEDTVIGSATWLAADGGRDDRYHVLTIRGGKIADMQECGSLRQAKRFARRTLG